MFIHNDTLQALGRVEDVFGDSSISLRPIFSTFASNLVTNLGIIIADSDSPYYLFLVKEQFQPITQVSGTTEFMVSHIHAFTVHTAALISIKGLLFSRGSRFVSYKFNVGFRYPCDGPGRGGTCQISSWDHIYLVTF